VTLADWLESLLRRPPRRLSELERFVGPLKIDFSRCAERQARPGERRYPGLRPEISIVAVDFDVDRYLDTAQEPRDLPLRWFSLSLRLDHVTVERRLKELFGPGRPVDVFGETRVEYGEWFYLTTLYGSAILAWEPAQLDPFAAPAIHPVVTDFLATLVDRLVCEVSEVPIVAALAPHAAAVRAELKTPIVELPTGGHGIGIDFHWRFNLPAAAVVAAFRWDMPVATMGDHRTGSALGPLTAALLPPWWPTLGVWGIDVRFNKATWPHGPNGAALPLIERGGGLPPIYDAREARNTVSSISILRLEW
jgi:hypothetical protein